MLRFQGSFNLLAAMIVPPTIADLQSQGVAGVWVTCCNPVCLRSTPIAFAAIGLAPETAFPAIAGARRFVCAACGSRRADVSHRRTGAGIERRGWGDEREKTGLRRLESRTLFEGERTPSDKSRPGEGDPFRTTEIVRNAISPV